MLIRAEFVLSGCNGDATAFVQIEETLPMAIAVAAKSELSNGSWRPRPTGAEIKVDVKVLLASFTESCSVVKATC
jgi:hypothetical protein